MIGLIAIIGCGGGPTGSGEVDPVLHWNEVAQQAAGIDHDLPRPDENPFSAGWQFGPTRTSRAFAIVHIAVGDAVAAITGAFDPYLPTARTRQPTSLPAAVGQAAHDTLAALYPMQADDLDAQLSAFLLEMADGPAKDNGVALGRATAAAILTARAADGSELQIPFQPVDYTYGREPGEWRADPLHADVKPLTPDWGAVVPFVIASGAQFRAPPPPALASAEYAAAYNAVRAIGGDGVHTPSTRSDDETVAGIYWGYDAQPFVCAPVKLYNQIAVLLAKQRRLSVTDNARLLALIGGRSLAFARPTPGPGRAARAMATRIRWATRPGNRSVRRQTTTTPPTSPHPSPPIPPAMLASAGRCSRFCAASLTATTSASPSSPTNSTASPSTRTGRCGRTFRALSPA